jgi:hypothetical protein
MFIPVWAIILVATLVVLTFCSWDDLLALLGCGVALVLTVSSVLCLYFWSQHQKELALFFGAPCILAMALFMLRAWYLDLTRVWGGSEESSFRPGRLNVMTLRRVLAQHMAKTKALGDAPEAIAASHTSLAHKLKLGEQLFEFYDHAKNLPHWHVNQKDDETAFWRSRVLTREAVTLSTGAEIQTLGIEVSDLPRGDECFIYRMPTSDAQRVFVAHRYTGFIERAHDDGILPHAYRVHVVELPSRVLLKMLLIYEGDAYVDYYRRSHVEAFRPGPWLMDFLKIVDARNAERRSNSDAFMKDVNKQQARQHFT